MLPEDKIGVVILSNLSDNRALEPIAYSAFDRLLASRLDPWLDRYKALGDKAKKLMMKPRRIKFRLQRRHQPCILSPSSRANTAIPAMGPSKLRCVGSHHHLQSIGTLSFRPPSLRHF
jgi:hypothetical protein